MTRCNLQAAQMIRISLRHDLASVRLLIFGISVGLAVILLGMGSAASDNQHSNAIPSTHLAGNRNTPPLPLQLNIVTPTSMLINASIITSTLTYTNYLPIAFEDYPLQPPQGTWRTHASGNWVNALAVESNTLWTATTGGVMRWNMTDGSYVQYLRPQDGLLSNQVHAIAIDSAGHKWFGASEGISEFDGAIWTSYNTINSGLVHNSITAIAIDSAGGKWFGTDGGGVSEFDGTNWKSCNTSNSGLTDNRVTAIAVDKANHKWFATSAGGVSEFDDTAWMSTPLGLTSKHIE